jgi:acetate kinase
MQFIIGNIERFKIEKSEVMKILVINAGSSSIKFSVFDIENNCQIFESQTEQIYNLKAAIENISDILKSNNLDKFNAIGHRVVHGGKNFYNPQLINNKTITELKALISLAPLHQSCNIEAMEILAELYPNVPQVACFDTAFHQTMAREEKTFAIPRNLTAEGIIRYGFHGLSYQYIASILPKYAAKKAGGKVIVAHLGNGASMCAMRDSKSVATTMGFSPLAGLMMGTRCGDIDPAVVLYLMQKKNMSVEEVTKLLYEKSGLKGVSEIGSDMRALLASDSTKALDAIALFCHIAAKHLCSLLPAIDGLDILVFTAGIGENCAIIRKNICAKLSWLGVEINVDANNANQAIISTNKSKIAVYVIPTDEAKIIAQKTYQKLEAKNAKK